MGIIGYIPVDLVGALAQYYREAAELDIFDDDSAAVLGATLVITAKETLWKMRNEANQIMESAKESDVS